MKKTRIYYVRHGQSYGNQHRIFLGHTDMDLTDMGRAQAARTAERLAEVEFAAIYSSDLSRAFNTALPHAEMRGMQVKADKRFNALKYMNVYYRQKEGNNNAEFLGI